MSGNTAALFAYTANGKVASFTNARSKVTGYSYDGFDRLATTTYPASTAGTTTESNTYDANDNVLSRTTRAGATIAFTYDTLNRLSTKTPPSPAAAVGYSYDLAGRMTAVNDNSAAIVSAVPPSGTRVQYETTYAYYNLNRVTNVVWDPAPAATAPSASDVTFGHAYNRSNQRIGRKRCFGSTWDAGAGMRVSATLMEAAGTMTDTKNDPRTDRAQARRVAIFTGTGRRRIWSEAEKARIVAEGSVQGASASAVARADGLTPGQVFCWQREGAGAKQPLSAAGFAAGVVADGAALTGTSLAGDAMPAAPEMIEIELRGARLRIPGRTRPQAMLVQEYLKDALSRVRYTCRRPGRGLGEAGCRGRCDGITTPHFIRNFRVTL